MATVHNPVELYSLAPDGDVQICDKGWFKHICCSKDALPKNCEWVGAPPIGSVGCNGKCSCTQFQLNVDTALDPKGDGSCFLCCDSMAAISNCYWTAC